MIWLRGAGELAKFDFFFWPLGYIPVDGELGSLSTFLYISTEILNPEFG